MKMNITFTDEKEYEKYRRLSDASKKKINDIVKSFSQTINDTIDSLYLKESEDNEFNYVYLTEFCGSIFYIGKHTTYEINDGYMGSGRELKNLLDVFPRKLFHKQILGFYDRNTVYDKERYFISVFKHIFPDNCINYSFSTDKKPEEIINKFKNYFKDLVKKEMSKNISKKDATKNVLDKLTLDMYKDSLTLTNKDIDALCERYENDIKEECGDDIDIDDILKNI